MADILRFEHVSKSYKRGDRTFYALQDANLSIRDGELVVILGPSGAGKSTLLNLMGGMDKPSDGNIYFGEELISKYNDKKLTKYRANHVGVVFQFYNLIPSLTAYENVALMKEIEPNIMDPAKALEAVGLTRQMHQFPSQMSGGEQQRTSIARAIAKNPQVLLCDEPTGALDTDTGKEVLELLQKMCRENKRTVIMVTHNAIFAQIADQVVYVKNGHIDKVVTNEAPMNASEVVW